MAIRRLCAALLLTSVFGCSAEPSHPGESIATSGPLDDASSNGGSSGAEPDEAAAAAAGEGFEVGAGGQPPAPVANEPCTRTEDCDDGAACNGQEACVAGVCTPGEAITCDDYLECSEAAGARCTFTDHSPWIVYRADDDEPGVSEVYAVKRDLLGKMTPILLEDGQQGASTPFNSGWAPHGRFYAISRKPPEGTGQSEVELFYFGEGVPRRVARLKGELSWGRSDATFAMSGRDGVALYDYSDDGRVEQVLSFSRPDADTYYGNWFNGRFVFASRTSGSRLETIHVATSDSSTWQVTPIIENTDVVYYQVSPSGTELVYELPPDADSFDNYGPLYAQTIPPAPKSKLVATAGGRYSFSWSPDGSKFVLMTGLNDEYPAAFLFDGSLYRAKPVQFGAAFDLLRVWFTPDSKQLLLSERVEDWGADISLIDPAKSLGYLSSSFGTTGKSEGLAFAPDQKTSVMTLRRSESSEAQLTLMSLEGREATLDSIPAADNYRDIRFSALTEFLAYTKGADSAYDGAYIDLRYDVRNPVRLPGAGNIYSLGFDDAGAGLYYIRELENGARQCFYLDLSRQVAAQPVKVGRDGRVDFCLPQPLTN